MKRAILLVAVILAAAGVGTGVWLRSANGVPQYRTAKVTRGDVLVTVTATGTVQPVTQVQVGTQVTGTIQKLLKDFNSRVKADELVAVIDPAPFQAVVDQNKANLVRAVSDVQRVKASLVQAEKELARSRELSKRELISASDLDAAIANYDSLVAQLKVADATVDQSKATLESSEVNLRYTIIHSPIEGVVISRNVDVGQTVAASLQAPTIFVIADSLKKIQIQASVAEADIGRIKDGQDVSFSVDAYRDQKFRGKVSQIRLFPTTVQNVVTYTVIIDADNPEERLLPGMTANAAFEVALYSDVLKLPNSALRFIPFPDAPPEGSAHKPEGPEHPQGPDKGSKKPPPSKVWIQGPTGLVAVPVTLGATDGTHTQILKGDLADGQEVVTGHQQESKDSSMSNPFSPRYGGSRR